MLGINERGLSAEFLRFGDDVQGHGGLAARFRAIDFNDAAAGQSGPVRAFPRDVARNVTPDL